MARKKEKPEDRIPVGAHTRARPRRKAPPAMNTKPIGSSFGLAQAPGEANMPDDNDEDLGDD